MVWLQAQGGRLGVFRRKKGNELSVDVRFCEGPLCTSRIQSGTEGKFYYDIAKILERWIRGRAGSSRGNCDYLHFLEESVSIPLRCVLPENFQIRNSRMKLKLMSYIVNLARDAAQKSEQSQAIRSHMGHAQASHLQTAKLRRFIFRQSCQSKPSNPLMHAWLLSRKTLVGKELTNMEDQ